MIGLLTKGCKNFRSIQILCERGLHDDASALVRVLMETTVAVLFILQKASRRRALGFHAHSIGQSLKMLDEWKKTPGLKRKATKAALKQTQILWPSTRDNYRDSISSSIGPAKGA